MSNNKLLYEAPVAETFVVRFEGKIMQGSETIHYGSSGSASGFLKEDINDEGEF